MVDSIIIREDAIDSLLSHALRSAKAHGKEVIGWLLGFFNEDGVCISESVPCTRYRKQARFGAEADPTLEAEVASTYPRNVGIVGLYHSHPFAMGFEGGHFRRISSLDDMFHSDTDDSMLKSRSSRRKNYLSIVTNGIDFSCFVMKEGSKRIEPELVGEIPYKSALQSYRTEFTIEMEREVSHVDMGDVIGIASRELMNHVRKKLKEDGPSVSKGTINRRYRNSRRNVSSRSRDNVLRISRENDSVKSEAYITLSSAVYTAKEDEKEIDSAMREEILDNIAYLLWKLSLSELPDMKSGWATAEVHLGSIEIDETGSLPRKRFQTPERGITIKRS
ncbi:MAG: hypothetical protein V3U51_03810 [Thermoplasmata archaeon]